MKLINYFKLPLLIMILLTISGKSFSQNELNERNAIKQVEEMLEYYNKKDFVKYVDYLLPSNYSKTNGIENGTVLYLDDNLKIKPID